MYFVFLNFHRYEKSKAALGFHPSWSLKSEMQEIQKNRFEFILIFLVSQTDINTLFHSIMVNGKKKAFLHACELIIFWSLLHRSKNLSRLTNGDNKNNILTQEIFLLVSRDFRLRTLIIIVGLLSWCNLFLNHLTDFSKPFRLYWQGFGYRLDSILMRRIPELDEQRFYSSSALFLC